MTTRADLSEFLLARIAEDEAEAFGTSRHGYRMMPVGTAIGTAVGGARLRAECEAKRRIIAVADEATGLDMQVDSGFRVGFRDEGAEPYIGDVILCALGLPYAGHPDYREEWRLEPAVARG